MVLSQLIAITMSWPITEAFSKVGDTVFHKATGRNFVLDSDQLILITDKVPNWVVSTCPLDINNPSVDVSLRLYSANEYIARGWCYLIREDGNINCYLYQWFSVPGNCKQNNFGPSCENGE